MANTKLQQDILKKAKDRIAGKTTQTTTAAQARQSVLQKAQNLTQNRVMVEQPQMDATRQRALDMVRNNIRRRQEDTNFKDNLGNSVRYSEKATTAMPAGKQKLQQGLYEETLKKIGGQIENEQNIISKQGRAEDDPARIRAAEELESLQKQQAETQAKLDTVTPAEKASMKGYTPEEEAYIRRIQQRLEKGQNRKQPIGYAYKPEVNSLIHLRNTPESADEAGYVKWLEEGEQLGLYPKDTMNALMQQTGTEKPYEQYKGLSDEYKSSWGDYKANAELQRIYGLQSAWNYGENYDYTNARDALLEKRDYYTGEKDKAQAELDAAMAADTAEAREKANRYQILAGEIPLPETWKEIRDENGAVIGTEEPTDELKEIIRTKQKPADYDARESDYDAMMYDFIYGQGAWNREFINGTDEEADQAFDRVEELWDRLENGTVGELAEKTNIPEYQSKVGYYSNQLGDANNELNAYLKVDELMSRFEGIDGADYDPELDRGRTTLWTYDDENYDPNVPYATPYTNDVHRIYSFINKGKEYQAYLDFVAGGNVDNAKVSEAYAKTALMNPLMKRKFNDLYTQKRYDEASAFLEGLSPYLNAMYSDYEHIYTEEMARQMPVSSSAASLGAELISGPVGVVRTAAGLLGDKSVADPYSEWYRTTRYNEQTQQAVADMIGGEGGKIYLQGMNTLRNMMNVAAVSLLGVPEAAASTASLAMFATQIYQDSTYKYLKEGNDYTTASAYALLDAALETAEEKLPYEAILADSGNIFIGWLANSISEALEEFTGATVGEEIKAHLIGGGRSEWVQRRDKIYNEGGYTDENGQWVELVKADTKAALAEAQAQALKEYGQQVIDNTLAGFIGGGLGAGYNVARGYINTRQLGYQIRDRGNVIAGQTGADQLISAARGMNKDTQSYKLAEAIYNKMQKGKQASNYQMGRLAAAMDEETSGDIAQIARQTVENSVREELTQKGVDEVTAEEIAPAIVEAAIQGDASIIPPKAQMEIVKSVPAVNVLKSFLTPEGQAETIEKVEKATEKPMNIRQTVSALMKGGEAGVTMSGAFARDVAQAAKRADIASQEELDQAKGTQHKNGLDAIVNDEIVQVTGMSDGKVDILKENGEHASVSVGEVQAAGEAMGTLLNFADVFRNVLDDSAFSTIVAQIENNKKLNGAKYVNEAVNTYIGYLTGNEVKTTALADKTTEAIRTVAEKAAQVARKERLDAGKAYTQAKPGEGSLKFDGAEYGTQEFTEKVKGLTRQQRNQAGALGELVKRLGVNVNLVNEDNNDVFGYEDNSGTLYINIGAKDQSGDRQNILTVAGHELTHWLEHTSETGYEELQKFVLDRMRKNGANIEAMVLNTIDRYRAIVKQDLSVDKALSEIVANACDQVLANEEVAKALNEENPGLFKQVQGFVKDFLARVKAATNYDPESALNSSVESRILMKGGQETMDELARIYLGARQEAISRQSQEPVQAEDTEKSYSVRQDEEEITNEEGNSIAEVLPGGTVTAYSLRSWSLEDVDDLAKQLVDRGFTKDDADKWIGDINDIAHIIAENQAVLDYEAAPYSTMLKNNQEYVKTLDASTLCAKRLLYQGIYNEIQHMLPNTPLLPEDLIKLVNMMKKEGKITPCGICYVESRRRMLGKYAQEWLKDYGGEYKPTLQEVTTTDGLEQMRKDHPQAYEDFVDAMNAKGSANPKVVQLRTDYKGEIRKLTDSQIKKVKEIGGLRVQSFSDFEVPHLIDMMQAVLDMAAVDLTSQAYTKVPEFAWVFGDTGMKINLSLIGEGTGLNEKGELVFSSTEGMDFDKAMDIRKAYSKNVGTILVGMNDDHIIAAMGDDRIDFIIPFHKSGWSKNEMAQVIGMGAYKDYTRFQNEKKIAGKREKGKGYKTVPNKVSKIRNFEPVGPNGYWREDLNGTQNAELYLQKCAADQRMPKFANFLIDNGDMSYRLPTEEEAKNDKRAAAIRKGYWKLLIDFKMYDNEGNYSPQETVKPVFNMEWARKILDTYEGGANSLPTDHRIAQKFVDEYKAEHPRKQYNIRQDAAEINRWMMGLTDSSLNTTQERLLVKQYQSVLKNMDVTRGIRGKYADELKKLQAKKNQNEYDRHRIIHLQQLIDDKDAKLDAAEKKLLAITTGEGYAAMMFREHSTMDNLVSGRTAEEVKATIDAITKQIESAQDDMNRREQEIRKLAQTEAVRQIQALMSGERLDDMAKWLRTSYGSHLNKEQLMAEMSQLRLRMAAGEDVTFDAGILAQKLVNEIYGERDSVLEALRGMTLTLTPNQIHEIAGKDGRISMVQQMLAGTGIKVQEGERSKINANWDDLTDMVPDLITEENQNPQNQAAAIVRLAQERLRRWREYGIQKYKNNMEDVTNDVLAAVAAVDLDVPTDPKAMAVLRRMNGLIKEMAGSLDMGAKKMADVRKQLIQMARTGQLASDMTNKMKKDVQEAIRYNNLITEQSEAYTWERERSRLVRQLKSEQTQAVLDEQLKWKTRIAQDKANREKMAENMKLRRQIHTNIGRIRTMVVNETDKKNVPEAYKPIAREMLMMIIRNDLAGGKPITGFDDTILQESFHFLSGMNARDGRFTVDDLNTLNEDVREEVAIALADIQDGIRQYNTETKGKKLDENLETFRQGLEKISNGVVTISNVINHARSVSYMDRERALDDAAADVIRDMRRIKKEPVGKGAKTINAVNRSVIYGNTTPVYFIKNLKNGGISELWQEFERAENRNGLELSKAKEFMDQVAEEYHYKDWDLQKKYTVTMNGYPVQMTVEQMMALYATWQREKMIGPEDSFHLESGGVILDNDEDEDGRLRTERKVQKPRKVKDGDIAKMLQLLTNDQKKYVHRVVGYLSREMSELGNEASMRMYGIKKYNEKWYFPFKVWNGVLSARSDKGITGTDENRAAHKSWSKRRKNNAGNALVIGNFTDTAVKHIVEMINYNTFAPAIENLNKVLNYQTVEQDVNGEEERRNIRIMFREAYGREALRYLEDWMKDLQGGATQDQRKTMRDRLLSTFKKNAVAGSLSVALQQPMSYIRANMMISPKYMTQALAREYWKGTYQERLKHSGVSVIKDMGRFDMNFGQSARDWISPEQKQNAYEWISDKATILPELMDRWTWNRMWVAVKLEQAALHPDMDTNSDEFLDMVGERFNDVMRKTQVYDSTMVKSSNMRSQNLSMKIITSFMAEPTLSLNVLADAVMNVKEKGGKQTLAKAGATFLLSAAAQAFFKGLMGSGRTPDDKKTWTENFLAKFWQNLMSEANPVSLIPGYSDIIEVLKNGELKDDAMGVIGKLKTIITTAQNVFDPEKSKGWYRSLEDTVGQVAQLFTNIPAKNLMRDVRAMYNWISGAHYADRPTSAAVLKQQTIEEAFNADNLMGVINGYLGDAGYRTTNKGYFNRMYGAMKAGNQQGADEIKEYLQLGKGVTDKKIEAGLREAAKNDESLTPAEQDQWMIDNDLMDEDNISTITTQYKEGKITEAEAAKLYKAAKPELTDDDVWWKIDRINYQKETGAEEAPAGTAYYYRLTDAVNDNKAAEIQKAVKELLAHGITKDKIKGKLSDWKKAYLDADNAGKIKIRDALQKAYQAAGYTVQDANKTIENWKKDAKKKK